MVDRQFVPDGTIVANGNGVGGAISALTVPPSTVMTTENKWVPPEGENKEKFGKKIQVSDDMTTGERVVICLSEVFGTAILVFLGCMGCVGAPPHEQVSLTFGLAVLVAVQVFGHVSGSHINPIVTVAAATMGNISLVQVPVYFVGQMLGAIFGFGLLKIVTPPSAMGNELIHQSVNVTIKTAGVCSPGLGAGVSPFQGFLVEFLATFILALVCCGVWDHRNADKHDSTAIRFGLTIAVLAMAAGPYTGANMNPARSFAPALFNGDWDHHWLYWAGPLLAGFLGALIYRLIFEKDPPKREVADEGLPLNDKSKSYN